MELEEEHYYSIMSRVAQLDSHILDDELYSGLLHDLSNAIFAGDDDNHETRLARWKNTDEWRLVCDALLYMFVVKKRKSGQILLKDKEQQSGEEVDETYGTRLNGLSYKSPLRGTLFLTTVLIKYLLAKSDKLLPSAHQQRFLKWLRLLTSLAEFFNFANFIVTGNYISILHRLLRLRMTPDDVNVMITSGQFSQQSRLATMEVQNRQLLWNAVLELLNMAILLPNSRTIFHSWQEKSNKNSITNTIASKTGIRQCPLCNEPPNNPYILYCCQATYCYWCCCKVLEWKQCSNCKKKGLLQASPLYSTL